jgi:hypothetical protein
VQDSGHISLDFNQVCFRQEYPCLNEFHPDEIIETTTFHWAGIQLGSLCACPVKCKAYLTGACPVKFCYVYPVKFRRTIYLGQTPTGDFTGVAYKKGFAVIENEL